MADQQGYEYDQYAPQNSGRLFSSSMLGFNKEEVLEYLDELADENYQRQEAAELQIQELTRRLNALQQNAGAEAPAYDTAALDAAQAQAAQLGEDLEISRAATQQAEEELAELRDQMYNMQQENAWLRDEYQKTGEQIADLQKQLDTLPAEPAAHDAETERLLEEQGEELANLQQALQQQEDELAEALEELATTQEKFTAAQEELAAAREELTSAWAELAAAHDEQTGRHDELDEANRQLSAARQEAEQLRATAAEKDRLLADAAEKQAQTGSALTETQHRLEAKTSLATEYEARIEDLRAQLQKALDEAEEARTNSPSDTVSAAIIADANAEADRIRAVANDEKERIRRQIRSSAGGLAESVTNLRGDLTGVESDVTTVLEAVQIALADILAALSRTEQNLNTLGVQVERFPSASAPVPKPPAQQVVYFQPSGQQPAPQQNARPAKEAAAPESYGKGGFRRVTTGSEEPTSNLRPFRPSYSSSPTALAAQWPQTADVLPEEEPETRLRALAETLVETLMEMMN